MTLCDNGAAAFFFPLLSQCEAIGGVSVSFWVALLCSPAPFSSCLSGPGGWVIATEELFKPAVCDIPVCLSFCIVVISSSSFLSFLIASLSACWCVSQSLTGLEFYLLQHMTSYSLVTQLATFLFPLNMWNNLLHAHMCNSLWITAYSSDTEQWNQALRSVLHFLLYKLHSS